MIHLREAHGCTFLLDILAILARFANDNFHILQKMKRKKNQILKLPTGKKKKKKKINESKNLEPRNFRQQIKKIYDYTIEK